MTELVKPRRKRNDDYEPASLKYKGLEEQLFEVVNGIHGARVELDVRVGIHGKCDVELGQF